ncbi:MAG: nuclear transport factor 2 family protein [Chloroflexota bacterium]|nr:nuclear transport factor 2 family protein [Chloroflexota bacterium]
MCEQAQANPRVVIGRLQRAINEHDLEAFVACFAPDYRSEQPLHPNWAFRGSDQVRENWGAVFGDIPDIRAELLRCTADGEVVWAEWHWWGNRRDGTRLQMRGVTIMGVRAGRIGWGRLYMEPVEELGADIGTGVRRMTGGDEQEG